MWWITLEVPLESRTWGRELHVRFEIALNKMDGIILTTGVARKSWMLSKTSVRYELKVPAQRRRAIQRKAFGDHDWGKIKLAHVTRSEFRLSNKLVTHT